MQTSFLQAIVTKFVPATNTRGARIAAKVVAKRITRAYDHELSEFANHQAAALELQRLMGWTEFGPLVGGAMPDQSCAFVIVEA